MPQDFQPSINRIKDPSLINRINRLYLLVRYNLSHTQTVKYTLD